MLVEVATTIAVMRKIPDARTWHEISSRQRLWEELGENDLVLAVEEAWVLALALDEAGIGVMMRTRMYLRFLPFRIDRIILGVRFRARRRADDATMRALADEFGLTVCDLGEAATT